MDNKAILIYDTTSIVWIRAKEALAQFRIDCPYAIPYRILLSPDLANVLANNATHGEDAFAVGNIGIYKSRLLGKDRCLVTTKDQYAQLTGGKS